MGISKFEGLSWLELVDEWDVSIDIMKDDERTILSKIINYIYKHSNDKNTIEDLREFATMFFINLSDDPSAPIWSGLLDIEDDKTFVEYCIKLIPYMHINENSNYYLN